MTAEQARVFRAAYDDMVRRLDRMSLADLAELEASKLEETGAIRIMGGPQSRDELVNAIAAYWYPARRLNESVHVLQHGQGKGSSTACEWCHPHDGRRCDCPIGTDNAFTLAQAKALRLDAITSREAT